MMILVYILLGWFVLGWIIKLLSPWLARMAFRSVRKRMERQMNDIFGATAGATAGHTSHDSPQPSPKKKIIDDEVGEYVRFEEVKITRTNTTTAGDTPAAAPRADVDYRTEEQIVDAEWEDI